ncbi:MAG: L,D-transpeptidase family protein [Pseudomonas sp.]|nr:L,D-transpeptidase family protein [Pseudomonas sp.]
MLFVASMGTALPAIAASQDDIARLLGDYHRTSDSSTLESGTSVPRPEQLLESCPHLAQLRTTDISTALAALYQHQDYAPLWNEPHRRDALHAELARLVDDGLYLADYPFSQQISGDLDVCAELRVSSEYLLALEHLSSGRFDQQALEPMWRREKTATQASATSRWMHEGLTDINAAFDKARPDLGLYLDLRKAYVRLRDERPEYEEVAEGELIRPGEQDPRVPQLAARLRAEGYLAEPETAEVKLDSSSEAPVDSGDSLPENDQSGVQASNILNPRLEAALKQFQEDHGLKADGVLGPNTLTALNQPLSDQLDIARINLERLRWVNAMLEDEVLLVNDARNLLRHYQQGDLVWRTQVITGRPGRETPLLVSRLNRITLNPDWTVPPTIRKEDMIPAIREDLGYLERKNLIVIDYQGNRLDPQSINWYDPRGIMLRQPPGPDNPLGQVVFRFDNPYAVYLHDTPNRHLFSRAQRNLSSGCVRVEGADVLADTLFSRMDASKRARVERQRASRSTHQVAVEDGPQVILGYWTAEADANGRLLLSQDPYGKDPALLRAFANR